MCDVLMSFLGAGTDTRVAGTVALKLPLNLPGTLCRECYKADARLFVQTTVVSYSEVGVEHEGGRQFRDYQFWYEPCYACAYIEQVGGDC